MGKKKRKHPDVEEVLGRPWCYYCERDFEDLKLLISHQKAKHFKCDECGRRLNTAGGLSVHMNQVHKETLSQVENALPNRSGLDVEIFGMEGIPQEVLEQHRNRIIQNFYQEQEDRRIATGNPLPGQGGGGPRKKIKHESPEELKARLAEWRARKAAERSAAESGAPPPPPAAGGAYPYPPAQQYPEAQYAPPGAPPGAPAYQQPGYQAPPGEPPAPAGLPQRPPGAGGYWSGPSASTVDELVAGGAATRGDDIDQVIRRAEAGAAPEKKGKREKVRMFYLDGEVSPEERMAALPRYALAG